MAEKKSDDQDTKKLTLSGKGTLTLKAPVGAPGGRSGGVAVGRSSRPVAVEVKKKRGAAAETARQQSALGGDLHLTGAERDARTKALQ